MTPDDLDDFTRHYLIAALWSSRGDTTEYLDEGYDLDDIHPDALQEAFEQCREFQTSAAPELLQAYEFYNETGMSAHPDAGSPQACAGHDFWLTRQHHGVGFWARGMGPLGDTLTKLVHSFPEVHLYVGDDGKIHHM